MATLLTDWILIGHCNKGNAQSVANCGRSSKNEIFASQRAMKSVLVGIDSRMIWRRFVIHLQISTLEEAVNVIDEFKAKFRTQGDQIILYRKRLRDQVL